MRVRSTTTSDEVRSSASPDRRRKGPSPTRRRYIRATAALAFLLWPGVHGRALAQTYPDHPVTLVVPFAPGGNLDITARAIADEMGKKLGQPMVVANRAGGGGVAGEEFVVHAAPDGYTIVIVATGSLLVAPRLVAKPPFKTADFAPIGEIAFVPMVLEVNAKSRFKTFNELIDYARANPGKVSVGNSGYGTTNHIATLMIQRDLGVKFQIVPYRGSGPALTDLLGGQIDAMMDQVSSSISLLRANSFRALATTTKTRAKDLPDVPTLAELGLKTFDFGTVSALFAPAKTPPAVVTKLNAALNAALDNPQVQQRLLSIGNTPQPTNPAAFAAMMTDEESRMDALFKEGLLKQE